MANENQRVPTNIGNKENSLGKELNIIISNGSEIQFAQLESSGTPVQVKNALIIAIPQDSNGNDIQRAASLWLSDKDGYLLELAKPISETSSGGTISQENVDALFLEYDDERSGGFEPLKLVSENKKVVLGLITTKTPQLEDKAKIIERIHEAAKYIPLDRLCLSPQCGFASCEIGNVLTEEEQWAKLKLVKEIAEEVWK